MAEGLKVPASNTALTAVPSSVRIRSLRHFTLRRKAIDIGETLYVTERSAWRAWLETNFDSAKEIWLVYPNKSSGEPRIVYNDAVEEALCFGWIDSIIKSLDEQRTAQRFTPRNSKSGYSQLNKERLNWLAKEGKLHPRVLELVKEVLNQKFEFPQDIMDAIKANKEAWENFQGFSPAYQRIRVAYIDGARRRPEVFEKRLDHFLRVTAKGKQIGYGGMEKYF